MTPKEFAEKWGRGKWEDNTIDLLADFHAAVESLMPSDEDIESGANNVAIPSSKNAFYRGEWIGFKEGSRWLCSRILEAIEQNVREK